MGFARRLRRIARAHLGDLRDELLGTDDPVLEDGGEASGGEAGSARTRSETQSRARAGAASHAESEQDADVPPEVAKAYRALEVPVGSDRQTVKKGYRRVMKKYHQDRFDEDPERRAVAGEVSKRLNAAYETVTAYLDEGT